MKNRIRWKAEKKNLPYPWKSDLGRERSPTDENENEPETSSSKFFKERPNGHLILKLFF